MNKDYSKLFLLCISALLASCSIKQEVTRISGARPKTICVVEHNAVRSGFLDAIKDGLNKNNINPKIISGSYENKHGMWHPTFHTDQATECDAILFYVANWTWDLALYMSFANIWITSPDGKTRLGQATYDSTKGGGRMDKFIKAREKAIELIDEIFSHSFERNSIDPTKMGPAEVEYVKFVEDVESKPKNSAIAVAKDPARWVWGGAWGAASEDLAKKLAMEKCANIRIEQNIASTCTVSHVNGAMQLH